MKQAKLIFVCLILITFGIGFFFLKNWEASEAEVASETIPFPKKIPLAVRVERPKVPIKGPFVQRKNSEPSLDTRIKPKGNTIEFRIVDGYAVAYGDILLGKPEEPVASGRGTYDAPSPRYWDRAEIPYLVSPDLPGPERVEKALVYLKEKTPLKFVPYSGQPDGILFEVGSEHCLSLLGKVGGIQPIRLSSECRWQEILHEVLHTIGFVHEQSRADRDDYIEILWNNIEEKYQDQFAMVPDSFQEPIRQFPFDYHSVMLYRSNAFVLHSDLFSMKSKGSEAIEPVQDGLSEGDIRRLNRMFRGYE
jgi:hypothetical protein